jgi:hypothetical protein
MMDLSHLEKECLKEYARVCMAWGSVQENSIVLKNAKVLLEQKGTIDHPISILKLMETKFQPNETIYIEDVEVELKYVKKKNIKKKTTKNQKEELSKRINNNNNNKNINNNNNNNNNNDTITVIEYLSKKIKLI